MCGKQREDSEEFCSSKSLHINKIIDSDLTPVISDHDDIFF